MRQALAPGFLRSIYDRLAQRYDLQHALTTAGADGRGRRLLVSQVHDGDIVLDAGGGTGSTTILAARAAGGGGRVVEFDISRGMLGVARSKVKAVGFFDRVTFQVGDIEKPPFRSDTFDVVLSTYSVCPLASPVTGIIALYDLVRPGGILGVAHSAQPRHSVTRWFADRIEALAWRLPDLSMGCRPVSVLPSLLKVGAIVELDRYIGVPLWPFRVFVVRKPA